ncbi:MAG: DUF4148 domain-containing protein [Hydrogenophaga sp.]|uniref:DUF4148 domain-containing protein n=1 Tax=Hydrogenophaga sp. TaxID=1904254 RepID=UPI0026242443|nr:DUF4148 domain-containing protein [Hydrogenophaga sp.]MDM7941669.1 DUF4148 domain-containing protein [Hydrogenophaga sp.]
MKNLRHSVIALTLTTLCAGSVFAADMTPRTRDQVRAELAQAQRDGSLIADGQTGLSFRQLFPGRYAQPAAMSSISRDQVRAELAQAQRDGTLVADGQTGATFRDLNPGLHPMNGMQATGNTDTTVGMGRMNRSTQSN